MLLTDDSDEGDGKKGDKSLKQARMTSRIKVLSDDDDDRKQACQAASRT
jgi:hypothetical protein